MPDIPDHQTTPEEARAGAFREAAAWMDDAADRMIHGSPEHRWARGAAEFMRVRATEVKANG